MDGHGGDTDVTIGAHRPVAASGGKPQASAAARPAAAAHPTAPAASGETGLVNSSRAVVGTVLEDAGFLVRPDGALFVVVHRPAAGPALGSVTLCSSLFAEQHTDYRREVRLARVLASAGFAVIRFHYRGLGNSAPAPGSVEAFARDALDVTLAARRMTPVSRVAFAGVGVGSLVASRALLAHQEAPLLLWKPVVDGAQFFRDFLRARLIAAARLGGARSGTTEELLSRLASDGRVDIMGFTVTASLYHSVTASRLAETLPRCPRPILLQSFRGARARGLEELAAHWSARGSLVEIQPVKLPEDPWFIPDGAQAAASVLATEEQLMAKARDWLLRSWGNSG